jgi:hypothetical protein
MHRKRPVQDKRAQICKIETTLGAFLAGGTPTYKADSQHARQHSENLVPKIFVVQLRFFQRKIHVWSDDEDQKILELKRRGVSHLRIAECLVDDFTVASVTRRFRALKAGTSSGTTWRPEEIETLMQKRQEGLSYQDIAAQLPGRTETAVSYQYIAQSQRRPLPMKERRAWMEADLQRLIETRVKERRSNTDIAVHLGRSHKAVGTAWSRWCTKLLPKETLQELYYHTHWTNSEKERLIHLHEQGLKRTDIVLQFPSKTLASFTLKSEQLHRRIAPMIKSKLSRLREFDWIALKTALEPYLDKQRKRTNWTRLHTAFPQFSRSEIVKLASVLRWKRRKEAETEQSDNDSVRVKDERLEQRNRVSSGVAGGSMYLYHEREHV